MINKIKSTIINEISDAKVFIFDPDGEHFQGIVISDQFKNIPLVKQHQLVMNALKSEFNTNEIHALQLKTFTNEKWNSVKDKYPFAKE